MWAKNYKINGTLLPYQGYSSELKLCATYNHPQWNEYLLHDFFRKCNMLLKWLFLHLCFFFFIFGTIILFYNCYIIGCQSTASNTPFVFQYLWSRKTSLSSFNLTAYFISSTIKLSSHLFVPFFTTYFIQIQLHYFMWVCVLSW